MENDCKPGRFKRGDTSQDRPGLVFIRYKGDKEYWSTPQALERRKKKGNAVNAKRRNTPEYRQYMREYFSGYNNTEKQIAYRKKYYSREDVKSRSKANARRLYLKDKKRIHQRMIAWRKRNPDARIRSTLSRRIHNAMTKCGTRKSSKTVELIGCSIHEYRLHIEKQFEPGMNWENYAKAWEIDHRVPLAAFQLADSHQAKLAFHFENCRPMWKGANLSKSDKIEGELLRGRDLRKANILPFQAA